MKFSSTFLETLDNFSFDAVSEQVYKKTSADVERALAHAGHGGYEDFFALISPAADAYLEEMAALSMQLTRRRFGNTISLYAPLYLSSVCKNICTYCGFSMENDTPRKILSLTEISAEAASLASRGFAHVLLLTGEDPVHAGIDYFSSALPAVRPHFAQMGIEVQPLNTEGYRSAAELGVTSVTLYQETYNREVYDKVHPRGRKKDFNWRLEAAERVAMAGIEKLGIGCLLGLSNWRTDSACAALHSSFLKQKYWGMKQAVSFPRLRPAAGVSAEIVSTSERDLIQLICAWRILDENIDIYLSTRENARLRDNACRLGVTHMSAGSSTRAGGYADDDGGLEQFHIADERSPLEIKEMLASKGLETVWRDWDPALGAGIS